MMLGAMLTLLSAQDSLPREARRLPFETGQLRLTRGLGENRSCAASVSGRGYEAFLAALCTRGSTEPAPGRRHVLLVGFIRAGETQAGPITAPGRRVYDVEAEVTLDSSGAFATCRVVREQGPSHLFSRRGQVCDRLPGSWPLFAPTTGTGIRQGRLRISIFIDAPSAEIAELLRPPPPLQTVPPPVVMAPSIPPPPPPPPPSWSPSSRPRPVNRHGWFSSDDYPAAALRAEEQGTVTVRLEVSPAGRAVNCTITRSSGSTALDAAACRIFRSRARYLPARDAQGRPVAGAIAERVRWELPQDAFLPREPAYAALSIGINGDIRTYCDTIDEAPRANGLASIGCRQIAPADETVPRAIEQGQATVRITLEIAREGMGRPEFTRQQGRTMFAIAAAFQVQPDGSLGGCRNNVIVAPRASGLPAFDLCAALQRAGSPLFSPRLGSAPEPTRLVLTVLEGGRR